MFKLSCVGRVTWNAGLQKMTNSDGSYLTFMIETGRERFSKYKDFLNNETKELEVDSIFARVYGVPAEYLDKHLKGCDKGSLIAEFNGYLELTGDKQQANSSKIKYYERDLSKKFNDPSAYEEVDSGFEDNVYIVTPKYTFVVKEINVLEKGSKPKSDKKTASRVNKDKDKSKDTGTEDTKSNFEETDEDWD